MGATRDPVRLPMARAITRPITQAGAGGQSLDARVRALFAKYSAVGGMWDFTDASTLFQDSAGTTPVTAASQPVGRANDLSGLGNHLIQATSASRPLYNGAGITFDGVNDYLFTSNVDLSSTSVATIVIAMTPDINIGYEPYVAHGGVPWQVERTFAVMYQQDAGDLLVYAEGSAQNIRAHSLADDVPVVITAEVRATAANIAAGVQVRLDGVPDPGTTAITNNSTGNFAAHPITVFGDLTGAYIARGSARRCIVIGAALTDEEKLLVEQWVSA